MICFPPEGIDGVYIGLLSDHKPGPLVEYFLGRKWKGPLI
jgi:hypothetical protein